MHMIPTNREMRSRLQFSYYYNTNREYQYKCLRVVYCTIWEIGFNKQMKLMYIGTERSARV